MKQLWLSLVCFAASLSLASAAVFTVTNTNDSGIGSLRQAILDANATPGADTINFTIAGSGVQTIAPLSPLPDITNTVAINGYSQSGSSPNTLADGDNAALLIRLDGSKITGALPSALVLKASGNIVRGLIVVRFPFGIRIEDSSGNVVAGNWIGMDADGISRGMLFDGITVTGSGAAMFNTIGGTSPADRNVISGNQLGISFLFEPASHNLVLGNFIGTDPSGTLPRGNRIYGISIQAGTNITIGGSSPGARNIIGASTGVSDGILILGGGGIFVQGATGVQISGNRVCNNGSHGIFFLGTDYSVIEGNIIGTDPGATRPLGNLQSGIYLQGANSNLIGGLAAGAGNVIQFNGAVGVNVFAGTGNEISGNRIHDNGGPGIKLNANTGANDAQNYPLLTAAFSSNNLTHVEGSLNSTPNAGFRLEFFASPNWDPQGIAEGQLLLGTANVITDGAGDALFAVNLSSPSPTGYVITATATAPTKNTSEFSAAVMPSVTQPQSVELSVNRTNGSTSNSVATVSWPRTATGFSLEHTFSLTPPTQWFPVSGDIYDDGMSKSYVITNGIATNNFFRLRLPQM
jgi:parallel beta-helix repeat protein